MCVGECVNVCVVLLFTCVYEPLVITNYFFQFSCVSNLNHGTHKGLLYFVVLVLFFKILFSLDFHTCFYLCEVTVS